MTVLVIGGGFLGTPIIESLCNHGENVVCLDQDSTAIPTIEGCRAVDGDITDRSRVSEVIENHDPDKIVHLAYMLASEMDRAPTRAIEVNCVGFDTVLQLAAANDLNRVIFASSSAIYGKSNGQTKPVQEDDTVPASFSQFPTYLYAATKQLNEYQARHYATRTDLEIVSVRPSTVFGPGRTSGSTQWASSFISDPAKGLEGHLPLHPEQQIGLVYYEDVANLFQAITLADSVQHDAYNTGAHVVPARELATLVEREIGQPVTWDDDANPLPLVSAISNERSSAEFEYDLTPLSEAIRLHANSVNIGYTEGHK